MLPLSCLLGMWADRVVRARPPSDDVASTWARSCPSFWDNDQLSFTPPDSPVGTMTAFVAAIQRGALVLTGPSAARRVRLERRSSSSLVGGEVGGGGGGEVEGTTDMLTLLGELEKAPEP